MTAVELTLAGASLSPRRFSVREATSSLFSIGVWARSSDPSVDLSAIVGHPASFCVTAGHAHVLNLGARAWSGVVSQAEQVHALQPAAGQKGLSTYHVQIVPDLWLLTQRRGNRIYQHLSIPDIVDRLLAEWHIKPTWRIDRGQYPKLEYKVQYAESDYDFFSRLLEEAGIAFTFVEQDGRSTLTLSDHLEANAPRPGPPLLYVDNPSQAAEREYVTRVRFAREVRPGAATVRDYDPRRPRFDLLAMAPKAGGLEDRYEQYHYDQGAFLVETGKPEGTPVADDRGFARHDHPYGKERAARLLHGERAGVRGISFDANTFDLIPGSVISIEQHPHESLTSSRKLLVLETSFEGTVGGEWALSAHAVFADTPYCPPERTPKPIVHGFQSATVVGPKGQEIHTDEYDRVRVQLPWDREGKLDEHSSCWVRVSQGWGGMGYGMVTLPRVGQEVLLTFLEGDPDQPVVAGRAYNAVQQVPYHLPEHKTRSTWKSDSSLGSGGFNEIMFEDLAGKELVWQQAQKDRTREVKRDERATVVHDRQKLVQHDEAEHIDGFRQCWVGKDADGVVAHDRRERIDVNGHLAVRGSVREVVQGDQSLTVVEEQHERVDGRFALRVGKKMHCVAGEDFVGEGAEDVTLAGPGGFFRIDASGVTISGTVVKINVSGTPGKGHGCKPEVPEDVDLAKMPRVFNLRWSMPKVPVGEPVEALFTVVHFQGNEMALVKVFECNADGSKKQIDQVSVCVKQTDGDVKVKWARPPEEAEGDLEEDAEEGDIGPLEYRFEVEVGSLRSEDASGPLWLTNTVVVEVVEGTRRGRDGTKVTVVTSEGKKTIISKDGEAVFENVLIGRLTINIEEPTE